MSLKRRDFNKMILAATGGLVAGAFMGCGGDKKEEDKKTDNASCSGAGGCSGEKKEGEKASCSAKEEEKK